jgi:glycerol-3-phosphate dehydrogenase (NAD(P)+)
VKVTILGAGAWGTALGLILDRNKHQITLWGHNASHLSELRQSGGNARHLPGVTVPRDWNFEPELARAIAAPDALIVAVPSSAMRAVADGLRSYGGLLISVTKGIDCETGLTMSGILHEVVPTAQVAALSGPTLALEVAKGVPTAIVAASRDAATAQQAQHLFHSSLLRVYTSTDLVGVEMGGALKNVVAIAAGVAEGLGFGDNSKAALLTRGIVEIRRLGVACGAQSETFAGLSGLGDLTVTCFSRLSRNRSLGERLGHGEKLEAILARSRSVAEGYPTARSAYALARRMGVMTPIIDEVHAVLYGRKNVARALQDLLGRESKAED